MHLKEYFLQLPFQFDAAILADEVAALPPQAWVPHPNKLPGNSAVRLVTPEGAMTEAVHGDMAPTAFLLACPYMMQVMAAIGAVWGRSRLMALTPGADVPAHVDTNYYWRKHLRLHVPITTTADVLFTAGPETVHMAAGEAWLFDNFSVHHVHNRGGERRVHLIIDTVGGERLWDLIEASRAARNRGIPMRLSEVTPGQFDTADLQFERAGAAEVMSPWEVQCHVQFIANNVLPGGEAMHYVLKRLERFVESWREVWAHLGSMPGSTPRYRAILVSLDHDIEATQGQQLLMRNRIPIQRQIAELIFEANATIERVEQNMGPVYARA